MSTPAMKDPINEAIMLLTEEADSLSDCHTRTPGDWAGEPEAKAHYDHVLAVVEALSELRAPKPQGDSCHHCGWLDWASHDGTAYCQACGKPHGSMPKEGWPNLPQLLRENADLDEAEGGNPQVCCLERDAADEIERLRREVAKLRAPVADERAAFESWARSEGYVVDLFESRVYGGVSKYDTETAWRSWQASRAALASAPVAGEATEDAFDDGWREATNWSGRDDLLADMDSFAYKAARARCVGKLGQLAAPQASEAQCSCPSGDGSLRHPCAVHAVSDAVRDALECEPCNGMGIVDGMGDRCPSCNGSGALSAQPGAQKESRDAE